MSTDSAPFLSFWARLLLKPRTFFRTYLAEAADRPPYFVLALLLYGVGYGIERADKQQLESGIGLSGAQSAVNHDGGSLVPAEEVDGDPRGARLPDRDLSGSRGTGRSP